MVMIRSDKMVMRGDERELRGDERDVINLFIQSMYDTILAPGDLAEYLRSGVR